MAGLGSNLLLNLWGLVIWQHGITVWLSTNIKKTIKRSLPLWKDNFLSARKGHSYTVTETFIWSLVHSHSEHIFTSMTLYFFFCRKAMDSLNKPDQTGPYCTPILCVLRVTRTEIKSYYSNEPCDMHKKHEVRLYILRTGVFWISSTYFYTGLAFPLPLQALLIERHAVVQSDQQQEGDPLFCSSISAIWAYGMPRMTMNLPLERHDALWCRYLLTAEQWTPDFLSRLQIGMCFSGHSFLCVFLKHGLSSLSFSFLGCYSAKCCLYIHPSSWVGFANHKEFPGATATLSS